MQAQLLSSLFLGGSELFASPAMEQGLLNMVEKWFLSDFLHGKGGGGLEYAVPVTKFSPCFSCLVPFWTLHGHIPHLIAIYSTSLTYEHPRCERHTYKHPLH